jgi:hypothetical protein
MVAQPCGAGCDEISAAMMPSAKKARKKRRAVIPVAGYLSKCESLAMAGELDLFPEKLTLLGCEEIKPSIKAANTKHPVHPQTSLDSSGTRVGFRIEPLLIGGTEVVPLLSAIWGTCELLRPGGMFRLRYVGRELAKTPPARLSVRSSHRRNLSRRALSSCSRFHPSKHFSAQKRRV